MLATLVSQNASLEEIAGHLPNSSDINTADKSGFTPLIWAVKNGNYFLVELLLKHEAEVDQRVDYRHHSDIDYYTPLMVAIKNNDDQIAKLLIKYGADIDSRTDEDCDEGMTPLFLACLSDHSRMIELVINCYPKMDLTYDNMKPLAFSCKYGKLEAVKVLLKHHYCTDGSIFCLLDGNSSEPIRIDILRVLLQDHSDLTRRTCYYETYPLHYLGQCTQNTTQKRFESILEATRLLVEFGADLNQTCHAVCYSPLLNAVHHNAQPEFVQLLIDLGANINGSNSGDRTALMLAADFGHESLVKLLIDAGADVNKQDHYKRTALTHAIKRSNLEITEMLLKAGAHPNVIFPIRKNLELTRILLFHGAKLDCFYQPLEEKKRIKLINYPQIKELITLLREYGLEVNRIRDDKVWEAFQV